MAAIEDLLIPSLLFEEIAEPATPAANRATLFLDTADSILKWKADDGTVYGIGQGLTNPMTTAGDIIVGGASGTPARLAAGATGTFLKGQGAGVAPAYATGAIARTTQGTTSIGASFQGARGVYLKKLTLATDGFVASIMAGIKGDATNLAGVGAGIFSDSGGNPLNVIAASGSGGLLSDSSAYATGFKLNTTARIITFPIGAWLVAADYWFAIRLYGAADNFALLAYSSGTGSDHSQAGSTVWQDSSIVAATTDTTHDFSIAINVLR